MPKIERLSQIDRAAIEVYGTFSVVDEPYGVSIRPGRTLRRRATLVEWTAQYMGFLCIFGTFGIVAGSTGLSGSKLDLFEAGILMTGVVLATLFFWIGTRGTGMEIQVDTFRRQFRTAVRNHKGVDRVLEVHSFDVIDSAFVHRFSQHSPNGSFSIRTEREPRGIALLSGNIRAIQNIHAVLALLTKPAETPKRQKSRAIFQNRETAAA